MPNIMLQRKYDYRVSFTFADTTIGQIDLTGDEFSPADKRTDPITLNLQNRVVSIPGPPKYGDFTIKKVFEINQDSSTPISKLIGALENLQNSDFNTFDMIIQFLIRSEAEEILAYSQRYQNCFLVNLRYDDFNSRGSDDAIHVQIMGHPGNIIRMEGTQMPIKNILTGGNPV